MRISLVKKIVLFLLLILGANSLLANKILESELIRLENSRLSIAIINPSKKSVLPKIGTRFLGGGWIRAIQIKSSSKRPLVEKSIFDNHPAFGFAEEFISNTILAPNDTPPFRHLKIGVGIAECYEAFKYKKMRRFHSLIKYFPWKISKKITKDIQSITFTQHGEIDNYGYILSKSITLKDGSDIIYMEGKIKNIGKKKITGEVYLHPFIKMPRGTQNFIWWTCKHKEIYSLKDIHKKSINLPREHIFKDFSLTYNPNLWLVGGYGDDNNIIAIRSNRIFSKLRFWRLDEVYAIEPFIPISLSPNEEFSWNWDVYFN